MNRKEAVVLFVLLGFSAACLFMGTRGDVLVLKNESLPANLYSNILAGLLGGVCLLRLALLRFFGGNKTAKNGKRIWTRSTILIGLCAILYALGITYVGFYVSTFLCMLGLFLGFENWRRDKLKAGLLFSLGLCLVFFVSFNFLKIYLPDGILF